jgi:endogenous inhibitor of DNA gyrase (YacG/DUF329 family)
MAPRCPTCRREVAPHGDNPTFPFCSSRCRLLDLGRWLSGSYRIAGSEENLEGAVRPAPPASDDEPS